MDITPHTPAPEQFPAIQAALAAAGLPHLDLTVEHLRSFLVVAGDGGTVSHCVGLEVFDHAALLRSLAVAPMARHQGNGRLLVHAAERLAASMGVATLYLLTTTARPFFEAAGYSACARDAVPDAILGTAEFTALCPASATCMSKCLDQPPAPCSPPC